MKNILLIIAFFGTAINSNGQIFPNPSCTSGAFEDIKRSVPGFWDCHKETTAYNAMCKPSSNRRYKFRIAFWNECWGTTEDDNCGWNKAGRVYFQRNGSVNKQKLHVGWRSDINQERILKISAYFHEAACYNCTDYHVSHYLTSVHTDNWVNVDMFLGLEIIALKVNNTAIGMRKPGWIPGEKKSKLASTFYFGGTCCPPRTMAAKFIDQQYDDNGFLEAFNSSDKIIWNISEFTSGDEGYFYAYNEIWGSIPNEMANNVDVQYEGGHPNIVRQKCIIDIGANITFSSGGSVLLFPGFHAKPGSHFVAKIETKITGEGSHYIPVKAHLPPLVGLDSLSEKGAVITKGGESVEDENINWTSVKENFQIFPNPSPGLFTLRFDDGGNSGFAVEITNMMGNVVYKKGNVQMGNTAVDIREQPKGVYFVKVQAGGKVYTEKVVVE
ncbi:MAG: T9SS type A sorting domain-containing protein [Chlorobi bacterium]|nr:T9SS type A sorting domain-containing protein [Chlorobiota bacterium]